MDIDIISIFPEIFNALQSGVCNKAFTQKLIKIQHWNPRDYTNDTHKTVDDRPFGGGPGMVMKYPPLSAALESINKKHEQTYTVYLSPQGSPLTQTAVQNIAKRPQVTLIAGRYAGIDQRVINQYVDEEISIGDFILSGGEIPAMALIDAIARLLPGILGNNDSAAADSFSNGLLAGPYYTRPALIGTKKVPEVLVSGNHNEIKRWRNKESLRKTWQTRPDLIKRHVLDAESKAILEEIKKGKMS